MYFITRINQTTNEVSYYNTGVSMFLTDIVQASKLHSRKYAENFLDGCVIKLQGYQYEIQKS